MTQAATMTTPNIAELLQQAEQQLQALDTASLDAELLLCHAANIQRSTLHAHPERKLTEDIIYTYQSLIEQRLVEQPVAYLAGKKEFWSMAFKVNEHTLIPRPETECLVEETLKLIPKDKKLTIADLGTGCGAIAISLAKERPLCHFDAVDLFPDTLNIARENALHLGVENISFVQSDWFEKLDGQYDLIVSNPPYIKEDDEHLTQGDVQHEPRLALASGMDGLNAIKQIIHDAVNYLHDDGWLIMEHGFDQGNEVRNLLYNNGYNNIKARDDYSGHQRVSIAKAGN